MASKTKGGGFGDPSKLSADKFSRRAKRGILRKDNPKTYAKGGEVRKDRPTKGNY